MCRRPPEDLLRTSLPMHFVRSPEREVQHRGSDRGIGHSVDNDATTEYMIVPIGFEEDRALEAGVGHADLVEFKRLGGQTLAGVDVDPVDACSPPASSAGRTLGDDAVRRTSVAV